MSRRLRFLPLEMRYVGPGQPAFEGKTLEPGQAPPLAFVTLTQRTLEGRFLLRPDRKVVAIILGVIGRALRQWGIRLYGFQVLCNHIDLVVGAPSLAHASHFGNFVFGEIARRINEFRGRKGKFFARRMSAIPTYGGPEDFARSLRYVLSNSVKEHAVRHALRWPGPHSARALVLGERLLGRWFDGTGWDRAKRKNPKASKADHEIEYEVVHARLPGQEHLSEAAYRDLIKSWLDDDAAEAARVRASSRCEARRRRDPSLAIREPGPVDSIRHIPVSTRPKHFVHTPAPLIHTSDPEVRRRYMEGLRAYAQALATERARLLAQIRREGKDFRWEGTPPTGTPPLDPAIYGRCTPPPDGDSGSGQGAEAETSAPG